MLTYKLQGRPTLEPNERKGRSATTKREGWAHATAAFSRAAMQAALEGNWPTFAHSILTTAQLLAEFG